MASQSELYKHLWEPKKTTRDWGTTEYHIIRTWTPRVPSSNDQPSAVEAGQSHDSNLRSNDTHQDSPPHDSEDNSAEEMDVEADINEEVEDAHLATPLSSFQSLQRGSGSPFTETRDTSRHSIVTRDTSKHATKEATDTRDTSRRATETRDTSKRTTETRDTSKRTTETRDTSKWTTETRNTSRPTAESSETGILTKETSRKGGRKKPTVTDGGSSFPGGLRRSTRKLYKDPNETEIEGQGDKMRDGRSENEQEPPTEHSSGSAMSPPLQPGPLTVPQPSTSSGAIGRGAEPVILASESGTESDEPVLNSAGKVKTARKSRKRVSSKTSPHTLWLTPYQRTGRDLNELDICLSTYDSVMKEAIQNEGDGEVQQAMVRHWKLTRKYILSTIRDLSAVSALEKRQQQEAAKNKKLQKESALTLSRLREVNGQYLEAISRAKQTRQTHKLAVEQAEIEELSSHISNYIARQK